MPTSLTIGDFSRATHLTVKTLRHYHRMGLLEPATVDPQSGYRRYSVDQIPIAQIIRRFRALDMPLDDIREVLASRDIPHRNELIASHLRRLEAHLDQTRNAVASLQRLLERPASHAQVIQRHIEQTPSAAIREMVDIKDALAWYLGALGELRAALNAQQDAARGPAGGIYANALFSQARGEAILFIPCEGTIRSIGRVRPYLVPAAELATLVHEGSYENFDLTHGALASHVAQHAIAIEGPVREYYLVGPQDTADDTSWRTEIGWPIFQTSRL